MTTNVAETLTPQQLEELERLLTSERARLERAHPQDEPFTPTPEQVDAQLDAVLGALRRLEEGRYGACTRCGAAIPFGRLVVLPESDHCMGCG